MLTLWDLLPKAVRSAWERSGGFARAAPVAAAPAPAPRRRAAAKAAQRRPAQAKDVPAKPTAQDRYDAMTRRLLAEHGVRVRKWRTSMSGVAWTVTYRDGRVVRLIEAPMPKGPMSAAVFLHEIGHHAIGFDVYKPRCLEEHYAWAWALAAMEREGVAITQGVRTRVLRSMRYAIGKARRRGIKRLPAEMAQYMTEAERATMAA